MTARARAAASTPAACPARPQPVRSSQPPFEGTGAPCPRSHGYPLRMVHAFVLIDAEPARVADLATELAELDGVAEVYSVAGHADIVAIVRVRKHEELADVVTRGISRRPGVLDTRTLIAFQSFSRHDLEAMWEVGGD